VKRRGSIGQERLVLAPQRVDVDIGVEGGRIAQEQVVKLGPPVAPQAPAAGAERAPEPVAEPDGPVRA